MQPAILLLDGGHNVLAKLNEGVAIKRNVVAL